MRPLIWTCVWWRKLEWYQTEVKLNALKDLWTTTPKTSPSGDLPPKTTAPPPPPPWETTPKTSLWPGKLPPKRQPPMGNYPQDKPSLGKLPPGITNLDKPLGSYPLRDSPPPTHTHTFFNCLSNQNDSKVLVCGYCMCVCVCVGGGGGGVITDLEVLNCQVYWWLIDRLSFPILNFEWGRQYPYRNM